MAMAEMQNQHDADVKMRNCVGIRSSNFDTPDHGVNYDRVFVPHYESYHAQNFHTQNFHTGGATKPPSTPSPTLRNRPDYSGHYSGLQGLLQGLNAPSHSPWPVVSANAGSIVTQHGLQYQQIYRKISEFQVALRASEKAREDGEKETQALRLYLSNVETAAAGLVSRVQDLENLLTLSTAIRQGHDVEQMRGQVATEAVKEAQKQATAAAQSIAMAREATMELDKVKRETNAWAVAQEAEIERLNMEAAECRMLYEASRKMIQDLQTQIANLQRQLEHQNAKTEGFQKTLQFEAGAYQKKYEEAKFAAIEKADQCDELIHALELSTVVGKAAELKLEELLAEKKEMIQKNEFLEQQVKELKSQDYEATVVQYDQELRRVRNALGDEKAQLLDDLAQLRRSNQNLTEEMKVNWQEKLRSSSMNTSSAADQLHTLSPQQASDALLIANACKPGVLCAKVEANACGISPSKGCSCSQEEVEEGRLSAASSVSASGSWHTEDRNHRAAHAHLWSRSSSDCSSKATLQPSNVITYEKFPDSQSQFQSPGAASACSSDDKTAFKELTLLAAAQHEISKLKEINEQLVAACQ